ncbi:MAG: hypothetical protein ACI9A1_000608, partial [Lentimonas sp.]
SQQYINNVGHQCNTPLPLKGTSVALKKYATCSIETKKNPRRIAGFLINCIER